MSLYSSLTIPELEAELQARGVLDYKARLREFLIELIKEDDVARASLPTEGEGSPEEPLGEPHQQIIDLTEYAEIPDEQGITPEERLKSITGQFLLTDFLSFFPPEVATLIVHENDIIRTSDYRDNGLYFVFDYDGQRYVIQTPGNYMIPQEALPMLQQYNVRTQSDFNRIYGDSDLDIYGIRLVDQDYPFAGDESEIGTEEEIYDPDNLPAGITVPIELETQLEPAPEVPPLPVISIAPRSSMFPRMPAYNVPSFLGVKKTQQ